MKRPSRPSEESLGQIVFWSGFILVVFLLMAFEAALA